MYRIHSCNKERECRYMVYAANEGDCFSVVVRGFDCDVWEVNITVGVESCGGRSRMTSRFECTPSGI